jgi:putative DNA primase/helicase
MSARDALRETMRPTDRRQAGNGNRCAPQCRLFQLTDYGNAERLVAQHGDNVRFVSGIGWLVWDGARWARDRTGQLLRCAKLTARALYQDAANCEDDEERKRILAWGRTSESEPRLRAMVKLAASELRVVAVPADLDADPWVLNVRNGTIDLRTGELRPHAGADLITKLAPVRYDPDARSSRWESFLDRATGGDHELQAFVQRLAGYTITGVTDEEILAFPHGPGATGKSTYVEAIKAALGDYASTADFETFLARRGDGGVRNDIARLAGVRMVISAEVDDGARLAEGLIKTLTGGDTVTARFLYAEAFEFTPAFTLWLVANARPRVRAGDDAIWRRILQIPFTVVIPLEERDPELKRALRTEPAEQSAILAWLVRGCVDWQQRGLDVPDQVRDYTAEYRVENDPLAEWIADECQLGPEHWTAASALRAAYEGWCQEAGTEPIHGGRSWGNGLKAHACEKHRLSAGHGWQGIALIAIPRSPICPENP